MHFKKRKVTTTTFQLNFRSLHLERGIWRQGDFARTEMNLCNKLLSPLEPWFTITRHFQQKRCPYKAGVRFVEIRMGNSSNTGFFLLSALGSIARHRNWRPGHSATGFLCRRLEVFHGTGVQAGWTKGKGVRRLHGLGRWNLDWGNCFERHLCKWRVTYQLDGYCRQKCFIRK